MCVIGSEMRSIAVRNH